MRKSTVLIFAGLLLAASSCKKKDQTSNTIVYDFTQGLTSSTGDSIPVAVEDSILNTILDIPEIKQYSDSVEKETKGKHGAAAFINHDNNDSVYVVNVGLNKKERFETEYVFYFYKKTGKISAIHQASGTEYPLREWQDRYRRHLAGDRDAFPGV